MTTQNEKRKSWFCWDTDFLIRCMEFAAKQRAHYSDTPASARSDTPASVRLAIIGCFIVGGIDIIKALEMSSPSGFFFACSLQSRRLAQ